MKNNLNIWQEHQRKKHFKNPMCKIYLQLSILRPDIPIILFGIVVLWQHIQNILLINTNCIQEFHFNLLNKKNILKLPYHTQINCLDCKCTIHIISLKHQHLCMKKLHRMHILICESLNNLDNHHSNQLIRFRMVVVHRNNFLHNKNKKALNFFQSYLNKNINFHYNQTDNLYIYLTQLDILNPYIYNLI